MDFLEKVEIEEKVNTNRDNTDDNIAEEKRIL